MEFIEAIKELHPAAQVAAILAVGAFACIAVYCIYKAIFD